MIQHVRQSFAFVVVVLIKVCQGITVSPPLTYQNTIKVPSLPSYYYPSTPLPPQLAYYARGGSRDFTPKIVNHRHYGAAASNQLNTGGIISVLEPPITTYIVRQMHDPYQLNAAHSIRASRYHSPSAIRQPHQFGFVSNYRGGFPSRERDGIVQATPAPQPPGRPPVPKPKRPVPDTFQIDQKIRNYQQQQMVEQQAGGVGRRARPMEHYRSAAIHVVQAPNLSAPRNPIKQQTNRLRQQHRQHFNIDQDEHPAAQVARPPFQLDDPGYDSYQQGISIFHDEANKFNEIKQQQFTKEPDVGYAQLKNEFLQNSKIQPLENFNNYYDPQNSYESSINPTPLSSYEHDDISGPIHDEFERFKSKTPRFINGPTPYNNYAEDVDDGSYDNDEFVPYKMLASVRHSERIVHQAEPDADDPAVKERVLEEGGHVVYTEQGYEDKQYDHGDEERFAKYRKGKREKRSFRSDRIPELSPICYAQYFPFRHRNRRLYDTKTKNCENIEFDDTEVNDKDNNFRSKKRLVGLGDKLDCMREKLFGADPFDNPLFKEDLVSGERLYRRGKRNVDSTTEASTLHTRIFIPRLRNSAVEPNRAASNAITKMDEYVASNHSVTELVGATPFKVQTVPPTIVLVNDVAMAKIQSRQPNASIEQIFTYPEVRQSELFIFDVSKFLPRLNDHFGSNVKTKKVKRSLNEKDAMDGYGAQVSAANAEQIMEKVMPFVLPGPVRENLIFISPHGYCVV